MGWGGWGDTGEEARKREEAPGSAPTIKYEPTSLAV